MTSLQALRPTLATSFHSEKVAPPSFSSDKINQKRQKKSLRVPRLLIRSSSSSSTTSTVDNHNNSNNNLDFIVEFDHYKNDHCNGTIPPFRIIQPNQDASVTTNTTKANNTISGNNKSSFRQLFGSRTALRSPPLLQRRRQRRRSMQLASSKSTSTMSQNTLNTLNTSGASSTSSGCTIGENDVFHNDDTVVIVPVSLHSSEVDDDDDTTRNDDNNSNNEHECTLSSSSPTMTMMMIISDRYYSLGKYYQYELCQPQDALQYYYNAYHTAVQCYQNVTAAAASTSTTTTTTTSTDARRCQSQLLLEEEIKGQIQLMKECIGRIYFELGNIDEALQML